MFTHPNSRAKGLFVVLSDVLGATILLLLALILGPLGVLRGPLALERGFAYLLVLVPQGLMAKAVRAAIDWRFGHFEAAIGHLEQLISSNEEYTKAKPRARSRRRVLEDLYTVLTRAYLHAGRIDDAMLVIIRARKSLGLERLSGLADLDAKTAHLVRAGLAAGRLLDGGGLAALFVKSNTPSPPQANPSNRLAPTSNPNSNQNPTNRLRQGAARTPLTDNQRSLKTATSLTSQSQQSSQSHSQSSQTGQPPGSTPNQDSNLLDHSAAEKNHFGKVIQFPIAHRALVSPTTEETPPPPQI